MKSSCYRASLSRVLFSALLISVGGCAVTNETSVIIGTKRPATDPELVRLYTSPPKKYVEIAIISADAAHDFMGKQSLMDKAVKNAKVEAAKVGANGILLDNLGDFQIGTAGTVLVNRTGATAGPVVGVTTTNSRTGKQLSGRAIFVSEE